MLTIVDRPLIQYAVDEAREAGIEQMIFVTGRGKSSAGRSFRHRLRARGDDAAARARASTRSTPSRAGFGEIVSVRQQQPLGLGHAVWCARQIVGDEPFAVLLPDDLMVGKPGALKQMVEAYASSAATSSAPRKCRPKRPPATASSPRAATDGALTEVTGLVEKPQPADAPSRPEHRRPLHPPARGHGDPRAQENAAPAAKSS